MDNIWRVSAPHLYDLDRMSVDLDFEVSHKIDNEFLNELKEEAEKHFQRSMELTRNF